MPLLQNEHARQLALRRLASGTLGDRWNGLCCERCGLNKLEHLGRKQCAQPKWGRRKRRSAAKLPVVRLEHELCTGRAERRQLLHLSNEQSTVEADVLGFELAVEGHQEAVLACTELVQLLGANEAGSQRLFTVHIGLKRPKVVYISLYSATVASQCLPNGFPYCYRPILDLYSA